MGGHRAQGPKAAKGGRRGSDGPAWLSESPAPATCPGVHVSQVLQVVLLLNGARRWPSMMAAAPADQGKYWPLSALATAEWLSPLPFLGGDTEAR